MKLTSKPTFPKKDIVFETQLQDSGLILGVFFGRSYAYKVFSNGLYHGIQPSMCIWTAHLKHPLSMYFHT